MNAAHFAYRVHWVWGREDVLDPIINFLRTHYPDLLSLIGIGLTVYFSWGAKSAATAAKISAEQTRMRLGHIEAADLVRDCVYLAKNIVEKIEAEKWDIVSSAATEARRGLVLLKHASTGALEATHADTLDEAIMQFRFLTDMADKIRLGERKTFRKATVLSVVHAQVDALIPVQEHIRRKLGEDL